MGLPGVLTPQYRFFERGPEWGIPLHTRTPVLPPLPVGEGRDGHLFPPPSGEGRGRGPAARRQKRNISGFRSFTCGNVAPVRENELGRGKPQVDGHFYAVRPSTSIFCVRASRTVRRSTKPDLVSPPRPNTNKTTDRRPRAASGAPGTVVKVETSPGACPAGGIASARHSWRESPARRAAGPTRKGFIGDYNFGFTPSAIVENIAVTHHRNVDTHRRPSPTVSRKSKPSDAHRLASLFTVESRRRWSLLAQSWTKRGLKLVSSYAIFRESGPPMARLWPNPAHLWTNRGHDRFTCPLPRSPDRARVALLTP